jgi:hypothetical protein
MNQSKATIESEKLKIVTQIAELSRLLGMTPSDDTIQLLVPLTEDNMILSDWLNVTRKTFLKLSLLISKELDIQLQ